MVKIEKSGKIAVTFHGYDSEEAIRAAILGTFQTEAAQLLIAQREARDPDHSICTCDYYNVWGHPVHKTCPCDVECMAPPPPAEGKNLDQQRAIFDPAYVAPRLLLTVADDDAPRGLQHPGAGAAAADPPRTAGDGVVELARFQYLPAYLA